MLVLPLWFSTRFETSLLRDVVLTTLVDLPYIYSTEGKVKEPNLAAEAGQGLLSAVTSYARGDMVRVFLHHQRHPLTLKPLPQSSVFSSVSGVFKTATGSSSRAEKKARETKTSPADVVSR